MFEGRYANDSRIQYFPQVNRGLPVARNVGIERSSGKYIAFCDSDDIWLPHKLAVQVACLEKFPEVGLVWTDVKAVDPQGETLFERYTRVAYPTWGRFSMDELFYQSIRLSEVDRAQSVDADVHIGDVFTPMIVGCFMHIPTIVVSRERINQIGMFNESMLVGEDYDFDVRACCAGPVAFIDQVSIEYRVGAPDQLTRPELMVDQARNFARTLHYMIDNHRDRIELSDSELNDVLAKRYSWLAREEFDSANYRAAREAYVTSLKYQFFQPKLFLLTTALLLPPFAVAYLRRRFQQLKASQA